MLRNKYGMTAERSLLAVVGDVRGGQATGDEFPGMGKHNSQAFAFQVIKILALEVEAAAEARSGQRAKQHIHISHAITGLGRYHRVL